MFFDLNIPKPDANVQEVLQGIVERGVKYGYRAFAVTTNVDEIVFTQQKMVKNKKKSEASHEATIIPSPVNLNKLKTDYPKVHFYNRINLKVSDNTNIRKFIQQKELKIYDLISFEPQTQDALKSLTSVPAMDILSYNPENRSEFKFTRKLYKQFVNQKTYFELVYAPGIADATLRKNLLVRSHIYKAVGKSTNIIVTSHAHLPHHIRGPYDVMNFNLLFGLSEEQSKNSLSKNCKKLLLRAKGHKHGKAIIEMICEDIKGKT